ncbi:hypothetical protein ACI65C_002354 [Semiaphis heraclei]
MADMVLSQTTAVKPLNGRETFYAHGLWGHTVAVDVFGAVVTRHSRLEQKQRRRIAEQRGRLIERRQHTPGLTGKNKR